MHPGESRLHSNPTRFQRTSRPLPFAGRDDETRARGPLAKREPHGDQFAKIDAVRRRALCKTSRLVPGPLSGRSNAEAVPPARRPGRGTSFERRAREPATFQRGRAPFDQRADGAFEQVRFHPGRRATKGVHGPLIEVRAGAELHECDRARITAIRSDMTSRFPPWS